MSFGFGFGVPSQASANGGATLNLNFIGSTTLDPKITFTRASSASYYNSLGLLSTATTNTPRFDYNPATLAAQGMLIEEQRTNLLTYSSDFDNAAWVKTDATVSANSILSPDGNINADTVTNDSTTAFHQIEQAVTGVLSTQYAISVYAKAGTHPRCRLAGRSSSNWVTLPNGIFDLTTGLVVTSTGDKTATIEAAGNGWYRCTIYGTCTTSTNIGAVAGPVPTGLTTNNFNGTTYPGNIYLWGAQLEAGAFPTSYIPTVAAQVTRAADNAVMTGTNFSSWYNASEGTLYVEGTLVGGTSATFPYMAALVGANVNNDLIGVDWTANNSQMRFTIRSGGVVQSDITGGTAKSANSLYKVAGGYAANNVQAAFDGTLGVPDTSATIPTITSLLLGGAAGFQPSANTWLRRITYYPRRLSNTELQGVTA